MDLNAALTRLLDRIAHGDEAASADLDARVRPWLTAMAVKRLDNWADAEDVAQKTLIAVLDGARTQRFRGEAKPTTWMLGILDNQCASVHRRRSREERLVPLSDELVATLVGDRGSVAALRLDLQDAMGRLTYRERTVVLFRCRDGLTTREIAGRIRRAEATVSTTLFRAVRKLRRALGDRAPARHADMSAPPRLGGVIEGVGDE